MMSGDRREDLSWFFGMLSDPVRRRILAGLESGELNVTDLCGLTGMRQQAVSHHLGLLKLRGLVEMRRRGKSNYYATTARGSQAVALMNQAGAA